MKRSEAIQKIIDLVYYHVHEDLILCEEEAKGILDGLEKIGFLPPFSNEAAKKSNQIDAPGYEWESEKEELNETIHPIQTY